MFVTSGGVTDDLKPEKKRQTQNSVLIPLKTFNQKMHIKSNKRFFLISKLFCDIEHSSQTPHNYL